MQIEPNQCKAARALLGWNQSRLAKAANLSLSTIADFDINKRQPIPNNMAAIRRAFIEAGIKFIRDGVQLVQR